MLLVDMKWCIFSLVSPSITYFYESHLSCSFSASFVGCQLGFEILFLLISYNFLCISGTSPKRARGDGDFVEGGNGSDGGGGGGEGGHGPGRGGGGGGRGGRGRGRPRMTYEERRRERLEQHDLVISRAVVNGEKQKKMGATGRPANLLANYFVLEKRTDWAIFHYRVDFIPEEKETRHKKKLLRAHQNTLGAYIFDGSSLYLSHRLSPDVSCVIGMDLQRE